MSHRVYLMRILPALSLALLSGGVVSPGISQEAAQSAAPGDRLVLLSGEVIEGSVTSITDGLVQLEAGQEPLALSSLRRIEHQPSAPFTARPSETPVMEVILRDGGLLRAMALTIADEQCQVRWQFGEMVLSIDDIKAVRFSVAAKPGADFDKVLTAEQEDDVFFIKLEDGVTRLQGFLEELTAESVVFEWRGELRTVPRARCTGFVLADFGNPQPPAGRCLVTVAGGENVFGEKQPSQRIWGRVAGLNGGKLNLQVSTESTITLPWPAVERLKIVTDRLVYLSDLEPVESWHQPLVTLKRQPRRDRSISGNALTLTGRTFEKGLGMASHSLVAYETGGKYDLLTGVIGIDDETGGRGDCIFVVRGDGRELFRGQHQAGDAPRKLSIDIRDVNRIELIVEPGAGFDLADHADWCDICFVRQTQ